MKLLRTLITLTTLDTSCLSPTDIPVYRALLVLGDLCDAFTQPIVNPELSLSQQLLSLSKFAHLAFALFRQHGGACITNQLYSDAQALVKAAFFCVARQQLMDPGQNFYVYQLGDDRLEEMFAEVRTETHDRNCDMLSLTERLSGISDSLEIYSRHPDWKQAHRRMTYSGSECVDHTNPTYYRGDLVAGHVRLDNAWCSGRSAALDILANHRLNLDFNFSSTLSFPGVDFLRPHGNNKYPGVSQEKDRSVIETSGPAIAAEGPGAEEESGITSEDHLEPDLEDLLNEPDEDGKVLPCDSNEHTQDWLEVKLSNGKTKSLHRASILNSLFNSDVRRLAVDRLFAVRCYSKDYRKPSLNDEEITGENTFNVGDIAVCPIRSLDTVAAALIRVTSLERKKVKVAQVNIDELGFLNKDINVAGQVLLMHPDPASCNDLAHLDGTSKWSWNGEYACFDPLVSNSLAQNFEAGSLKSLVIRVPGELVHPIHVEIASTDGLALSDKLLLDAKGIHHTWSLDEAQLVAAAVTLLEPKDQASLKVLTGLAKHGTCKDFPYRNHNAGLSN